MNTYGIHWAHGNADYFDTREEALENMAEAGFIVDNGDADCLVWESEEDSENDDGSNAIGRLFVAY